MLDQREDQVKSLTVTYEATISRLKEEHEKLMT